MDTDALIVARLGEHQRKIERLNQIRQSGRKRIGTAAWYWVASAVACVAIVFALVPGLLRDDTLSTLNLEQPSLQEYRGSACNAIESAMDSGNYKVALELTESAITASEFEIKEYQSVNSSNSQESEYMMMLERQNLEDLIWTKIYLLVRSGDEDGVLKTCELYMENADFQVYRTDVENILMKIKK